MFTSGLFVQDFLGAVLCCVLFGVGIGGVTTFMNIIYAESLGIESIQVRTGFWVHLVFFFFLRTQ